MKHERRARGRDGGNMEIESPAERKKSDSDVSVWGAQRRTIVNIILRLQSITVILNLKSKAFSKIQWHMLILKFVCICVCISYGSVMFSRKLWKFQYFIEFSILNSIRCRPWVHVYNTQHNIYIRTACYQFI